MFMLLVVDSYLHLSSDHILSPCFHPTTHFFFVSVCVWQWQAVLVCVHIDYLSVCGRVSEN